MTDLPALFHLEAVRSAGMSGLLLLDLDNTLADRDRAYSAWAQRKAAQWKPGDRSAVQFLIDEDRDGLRPRRELLEAVRMRFGRSEPADELLSEYRSELLAALPPVEPAIIDRLKELRAAGWRLAIVTNGQADVQQAKISHLGLRDLLDAWCISGALGIRKPDARIFKLAAEACDMDLAGAWMIGDGIADIEGARNAGIHSIWLTRGRRWERSDLGPDLSANNLGQALSLLP